MDQNLGKWNNDTFPPINGMKAFLGNSNSIPALLKILELMVNLIHNKHTKLMFFCALYTMLIVQKKGL